MSNLASAMEKMVDALAEDHGGFSGQGMGGPARQARVEQTRRTSILSGVSRPEFPVHARVTDAPYRRAPLPIECELGGRPVYFYLCHQADGNDTRLWVEAEYPINALRTTPWRNSASGDFTAGYRTRTEVLGAFLPWNAVPTNEQMASAAQATVEAIRARVSGRVNG